MGRRSRTGLSVTLFPFLAVLICTMGALILLLLAMTNKIRMADARKRASATQVAAALPPEPVAAIRRPVAAEPALLAEIAPEPTADPAAVETLRARRRQAWEARLQSAVEAQEELRRMVARRERDHQFAQQAATGYERRRAASEGELTSIEAEEIRIKDYAKLLADQEVKLREQALRVRQQLDLLKKSQAAASSEFALVPYDGASGTVRRPIYIECSARGLTFLTEGVTITESDLMAFTPDYNPVAVGVDALARYWLRKSNSVDDPSPYVLLIVRPDGALAYYAARALLGGVDVPFGYELIENEFPLNVGVADVDATETLKIAIDESMRTRDAALASAGIIRPRSDPSEGFRRGGSGGEPGQPGVRGGASRPNGPPVVVGPGGVLPSGPGNRTPAGVGGNGLSERGAPGGNRNPTLPAGTGRGGPGTGTSGESGGPVMLSQRRQSTGGTGFGQTGSGILPGEGGAFGSAPGGQAASLETPNGVAGGNSVSAPAAPIIAGASSGPGTDNPQPGDERAEEPSLIPGQPVDSQGRIASRPVSSPGGLRPVRRTERDLPTLNGRPLEVVGAQPDEEPLPHGTGGTRSLAMEDSARQRGGVSAFSMGGAKSARDGQTRPGLRWGESRGRTIGLERQIEMHLYGDRFVVGPRQRVTRLDADLGKEDLLTIASQEVDEEILNWGSPPNRFHWLPRIHFVVHPGGNQHYERMHKQLKEWGLASTVDYELTGAPATQGVTR